MKTLLALFILTAGIAKAVTISSFELPNMNDGGKIYSSKTQSNAVFVVEAYFLGCPYCNENAPNVNELAKKYASNKRVQVLDVGIDKSDSSYEEWIRRHSPNHPVLKDNKKTLISQLGTTGYPSTYVINANGEVVFESAGVWGAEEEEGIINAIEGLLHQ